MLSCSVKASPVISCYDLKIHFTISLLMEVHPLSIAQQRSHGWLSAELTVDLKLMYVSSKAARYAICRCSISYPDEPIVMIYVRASSAAA